MSSNLFFGGDPSISLGVWGRVEGLREQRAPTSSWPGSPGFAAAESCRSHEPQKQGGPRGMQSSYRLGFAKLLALADRPEKQGSRKERLPGPWVPWLHDQVYMCPPPISLPQPRFHFCSSTVHVPQTLPVSQPTLHQEGRMSSHSCFSTQGLIQGGPGV